jgi:prepilin-type N-terminal cleavage/methylation domain-containing protein
MVVRRLRGEAGFTLAEMMIASAIMLTVTAAVFSLMNPAQGIYKAQPEVSDEQQRLRVGVDTLTKDLVMAGAGTYAGSSAGSLFNYFAPIMPYRMGDQTDDPTSGVYYRVDAITLLYVPPTPSQTTISDAMPRDSQELKVNAQPNCPKNKQDQLCGFEDGMRALIFDPNGGWDPITITQVQDPALHLQHDGKLSQAYAAGSWITQLSAHTYYLKTDVATNTYQLMHYDGYKTDLPIVDNVVKLEFSYFGEPQPPTLIPGKSLTDTVGPWTTYGPKPPVIGVNNPSDSWGAGENCAFVVQNGAQVPRMAVLAAGTSQVELPGNLLKDGPWCPDDQYARRFDADLLRIRRVRVRLRVQVALASLRGPAGVLFTRGGTANSGERYVPDQQISFDVTPRNLNLGR